MTTTHLTAVLDLIDSVIEPSGFTSEMPASEARDLLAEIDALLAEAGA